MTLAGSPLSRIGLLATLTIMIILGLAATRESERQRQALDKRRIAAIRMATDLYALYCAECHGSAGQGDVQKDAKALNNSYERSRKTAFLFDVVARGRDNTDMAAFSLASGSVLNRQQIDSLVTLIQYGSWDQVAQRVQEMGMVSEEELALAAGQIILTDGLDNLPVILVLPTSVPTPAGPTQEELSKGLYLTHCAACHGAEGEGTDDGPALTTDSVRAMSRAKLIKISFDNDEIEGHGVFLSPGDKNTIVKWIEQLAGIQR
jgi:mono/diheme cytochrome c family protein